MHTYQHMQEPTAILSQDPYNPQQRPAGQLTLLEMLVIKLFISSWVGQLFWQGASAHFKHLQNKET